jgi:PmbA protein
MDIVATADRVERLLKTRPLDGYEIMTGHSRSLAIEAKEGKIDTFKSAEPVGVSVRLLKDGGMGFSFSSSLDDADLERMIEGAMTGAETQSPEPCSTFPEAAAYAEMPELFDPELAGVEVAAKIGRALELEQLTLAADSRIARVRKATYGETVYTVHLRNSNGVYGGYTGSSVSSSVAALAESGGESQMGWDFDFNHCYEEIDITRVAGQAAAKAVAMLGARNIPTMNSPVVLENHVVAEFLELLAPSFSAENLFKGKSLLKDRVGQELFSKALQIRDDGTLAGGMATSPFDGEGVAQQNTVLVANGVLQGYLFDTLYAGKMASVSTGNSARGGVKGLPHLGVSNLFIENGAASLSQLLGGIPKGLLITSLIGMHTANPVSGDFSVGASGFMIEDGLTTFPVKGVAISGNVMELFRNVELVCDDLRFYSAVGSPALKIGSLDISGT